MKRSDGVGGLVDMVCRIMIMSMISSSALIIGDVVAFMTVPMIMIGRHQRIGMAADLRLGPGRPVMAGGNMQA